MKYFFILIFTYSTLNGFCQSNPNEKMPQFDGGYEGFIQYLKSVPYPYEANVNCITGTVYVNFIINKSGNVDSVWLVSSVDPFLDSAAINHIKNTNGHWTKGMRNDTAVNVHNMVPFNFTLVNSDCLDKIYYYNQGVKFDAKGNYAKALKNYKIAIKMDAYYTKALFNSAVICLKTNDLESACYYLNQIKASGKTDGDKLSKKYCAK